MAIRTAGCIENLPTVIAVAEMKMHPPYFLMPIFGLYGVCGHLLISGSFCVPLSELRPAERNTTMKLKIRYENEFQTIELDAKATEEMWVTLSIETDGVVTQDEKEQLIQEEWDKQFNRPEYNVYHRETRHIDPTPKKKRMDGKNRYISAEPDDKSFNIMDYLNTYDPTEGYCNKFEYEECCKRIRAVLKLAHAEMLIAIILDGMTVEEYAETIGDTANNVSHRYRRALKKLEKVF